ncbi:MAG: (2Fe-2S)-binding protein [Candidatus Binataceae bacterium]|jgi:carbon-monoxide dehydrogenase small subunit
MKYILSFSVNGQPVETLVEPTISLLDVLRDKLDITSPKRGCESGDCGGCTVLVDGKAVTSCLTVAMTVEGAEVTTVEGLAHDGQLHPLQKEFYERGAAQCGFCTSGMLMAAKGLLDRNPTPTREEIVVGMSGNLCRCGGYVQVMEAIEAVAAAKSPVKAEDNGGRR